MTTIAKEQTNILLNRLQKEYPSENIKLGSTAVLKSNYKRDVIVSYTNTKKITKLLETYLKYLNTNITDSSKKYELLTKDKIGNGEMLFGTQAKSLSSTGVIYSPKPASISERPIVIVIKPGDSGARVSTGTVTQDMLAEYLNTKLDVYITSIASRGVKTADVVGNGENYETKGTDNFNNKIGVFDKTVRRGGSRVDDSEINEIAKVLASGAKPGLVKSINEYGSTHFLTDYIDWIRKNENTKDNIAGFSGDVGISNYGKLPSKYFITRDSTSKEKIVDIIRKHFVNKKDNYFVLVHKTNKEFIFFKGTDSNTSSPKLTDSIIKDKILNFDGNSVELVGLQTYGQPSSGGIRASVVIKLAQSVISKKVKQDK